MGAEMGGVDSLKSTLKRMADKWGGQKKVVYLVGTNVEYGPFVEFGTSPHTIEPDGGEALKFTVGGETVFAKSVDHPGTDAQPFMRPAAEEVERSLDVLAKESDSVEDFVQRAALMVEREAKQRVEVKTGNLQSSIRTERVE